jgi:hypothetical protein
MKRVVLSLKCDIRNVTKCLIILGGTFLVGVAGWLIVCWAANAWYFPYRAVQLLKTLNAEPQTSNERLHIIEQAMAMDRHNLDVRLQLAFQLTQMKSYEEAARAWAYIGKHWDGHYRDKSAIDQGICHLFAHEYAFAVTYFQRGILSFPEDVNPRVYMAAAYAKLGFPNRVREELVMLSNLDSRWQHKFEGTPEYVDEAKATIEILRPYFENSSGSLSQASE